jgi:hypothetical protein
MIDMVPRNLIVLEENKKEVLSHERKEIFF